jgi:hypothetical protein
MKGEFKMNPQEILAFMDGVRAETLRRFEPLTQAQLDWRPPELNGDHPHWSLGEIFLHIALDEHYLREHISRPLLEGVKPPDTILFLPPPPQHRLPKEAIQFWFDRARVLTRRMIENGNGNWNLELRHSGGFEEESNGAEWLMGYAGHEKFHHKQLDEMIARVQEVK